MHYLVFAFVWEELRDIDVAQAWSHRVSQPIKAVLFPEIIHILIVL